MNEHINQQVSRWFQTPKDVKRAAVSLSEGEEGVVLGYA